MTQHQGRARTPLTTSQPATQNKLRKLRPTRFTGVDIQSQLSTPVGFISARKVREIVTISGRGVRGYFPSWKGKLLKFESLGEEDVLRTLEVANLVEKLVTQPCVLEFEGEGKRRRYTPDVLASIKGISYFIETKSEGFQKNSRVVNHLRDVIRYLRREKAPFILITANDVRVAGLQDELKDLLSKRPCPGRFDPDIDPTLWDPRNLDHADADLLERWHRAQEECNALIRRLMNRDPDSLLTTTP